MDPPTTRWRWLADWIILKRRALMELVGGGLTLAIWLGAEATGTKLIVLAILVAIWTGYFTGRAVRHPILWREWGIIVHGWGRALRWHGGAALAAFVVVATIGAFRTGFGVPDYAWVLILLYPPWALCQQFILQVAVVANAATLGVPRPWLPLVGMIVLGSAHLPDLPLAGLTALGGLLWTWLWLRAPNLWLLALGHAFIGSFAFIWVLKRDPLLEFPQIISWLAGG